MGKADRQGLHDCIVSSLEGSKLKINLFLLPLRFCVSVLVF